jgi:hypothetical protein
MDGRPARGACDPCSAVVNARSHASRRICAAMLKARCGNSAQPIHSVRARTVTKLHEQITRRNSSHPERFHLVRPRQPLPAAARSSKGNFE